MRIVNFLSYVCMGFVLGSIAFNVGKFIVTRIGDKIKLMIVQEIIAFHQDRNKGGQVKPPIT